MERGLEHARLAARLLEAGAGELGAALRLNGELPCPGLPGPGGGTSSASLCLSSRGLFLVLRRVEGEAGILDLLAPGRTLRYHTQLLGDRVEIDGQRLGVPWRHGEQVRAMIGRARLRRGFGVGLGQPGGEPELLEQPAAREREGSWAWVPPFVDLRTAAEREWLRLWLDTDERLLVFRRSDELHRLDSLVRGPIERPLSLVITDRRQQLVALSEVGDLWSEALEPEALRFEAAVVGRASVGVGARRLLVPLGDERLWTACAPWPGAPSQARLRLLARALWLRRGGAAEVDRAVAILDEIASLDPLARLARVLVADPSHAWIGELGAGDDPSGAGEQSLGLGSSDAPHAGEGEGERASERASEKASEAAGAARRLPAGMLAALQELVDAVEPLRGEVLVEWWREWEIGVELGEILVEHLCELGRGGLALALPLHEELRQRWLAKLADDPEGAALIDFVLAEHLLALGEAERALQLLRSRREQLPSEELHDLLPPAPDRGGQRIRIELYELAAAAHAALGPGHLPALAELARLQPLELERIEALLERLGAQQGVEDDSALSMLVRARIVRELLEEQLALPAASVGLSAVRSDAEHEALEQHTRVAALEGEELELLRHPAARADGVLGRLQGALAKVVVPDCSVLKSYCERANLARTPALARAMADATMILGLGGVEVFVSRGDKSVGMRAYEGDTSFLLIGGDHLDPSSDAFLDEGPLRFAITAELAHLRYAHSRVTANEVWAGSLDLGLTGLGMLIVAAPVLKKLKAPAKHLLDKVGAPAIDRWRKKLAKRDPHSLANDNSQVIAAYRVMQLSADRAGLVACGDPRAAIRAMFAAHPGYLALWPLVGSHGLRAALTKSVHGEDERLRLEDLAVRVAALLSFYLSDDYAELRASVLGGLQ